MPLTPGGLATLSHNQSATSRYSTLVTRHMESAPLASGDSGDGRVLGLTILESPSSQFSRAGDYVVLVMLIQPCIIARGSRGPSAGAGPTVPVRAAPTLNTCADVGRLFKVLSVEVINLRCVSTAVEMPSTFHKRPRMKHTGRFACLTRCGRSAADVPPQQRAWDNFTTVNASRRSGADS